MNTALRIVLWTLVASAIASCASALEHISIVREGKTLRFSGRILTEAADGGLLALDREGVLWAVQPEELKKREADDTAFSYLSGEQLAARLLGELPAGFRVHKTAHYLICYNTSTVYAEWCGALYERLYAAFRNFWQRKGLELYDPPQPLVALVFDTLSSYSGYARAELGDATARIVGYYNLRSNRMTMYDLTGTRGLQHARRGFRSTSQVNALLSQPKTERMVATIIHEATHQLAYNCGLHQRYADIPLWVSEGIAVYFETPDLRSSRGWRSIGTVHRHHLDRFRRYSATRPADSLDTLIGDDGRFRESHTTKNAYAEAWSLTYYLLRKRSEDYVRYLRILAKKPPMVYDTPEDRVRLFAESFGEAPAQMDADFLRYMWSVR